MKVKELRELIATMPDDAPVYVWVRGDDDDADDVECRDLVHRFTADVESPCETSIHFQHD